MGGNVGGLGESVSVESLTANRSKPEKRLRSSWVLFQPQRIGTSRIAAPGSTKCGFPFQRVLLDALAANTWGPTNSA